jgi:site-specific DNA-methyltransferase (adenine-specific)
MVDPVMFRSGPSDWETPPELFDRLWEQFGPFDLDPCCRPDQHSAQRVWKNGGTLFVPSELGYADPGRSIIEEGLCHPWNGRVFMNPPFGPRGIWIPQWVGKAVGETVCGNARRVVALLPARTDTRWWQDFILKGINMVADCHAYLACVQFLPGRLRFVGAKWPAPFPSAVVVWEG